MYQYLKQIKDDRRNRDHVNGIFKCVLKAGKMNKTNISIIVPVYNVEEFLSKCIDSILAQSYSHFELLLIDDGSKDNSGKICDEYAQKDKRIKVIHQKNAGVSAARNRGISEAKGDYICFIDADDWVNKEYLETFSSLIKDSSIDFIVSGYTYDFISSGQSIQYSIFENKANTSEEFRILLPELHNNNLLVSIWSKLFKKSIIDRFFLSFDTKMNYCEDAVFCWNYLLSINSIYVVENAGYHYRKDDSDTLTKKKYPFEIWYDIAEKVLKANQAVIDKFKLSTNDQIMQKIYDYYLAMFLTANYSMYEKKYFRERKFRLGKWKEFAEHKYMRIKPEESVFVKIIKKLLTLKQYKLVDILMNIRSKIL